MKLIFSSLLILSFSFATAQINPHMKQATQTALSQNGVATNLAGAADVTIAKKLYNICTSSVFAVAACVQSTVALAQAVANFASSKKSKSFAAHVDNSGQEYNPAAHDPNGTNQNGSDLSGFSAQNPPSDAEFLSALNSDLKQAFDNNIENPYKLINELEQKGYSFDPDTGGVNTPEGFVSAGEVQSQGQKLAASEEFKAFQNDLNKKVKKYLSVQRLRSNVSGGHIASAPSSSTSKTSTNPFAGFKFSSLNQPKRNPSSLVGVKLTTQGDPLTTANGQLFQVMENAYKELISKKHLPETTK